MQAHVNGVLQAYPDFQWRWQAVLARLAATGHVAGEAIDGNVSQRATAFEMDGWRVKLAWRVLGDTLRVVRADF